MKADLNKIKELNGPNFLRDMKAAKYVVASTAESCCLFRIRKREALIMAEVTQIQYRMTKDGSSDSMGQEIMIII